MQYLEIDKDGETIKVWAHKTAQGLWFHCDGETFFKELVIKKSRSTQGGDKIQKDSIAAPMPGKIIKVNVAQGDSVQVGDILIVMEAMKMEYSLKAEVDGEVKEVLCELNANVDVGQKLVQLQEVK